MKHCCSSCVASVTGGMIIGAVLAMLFTPKSGCEMRRSLCDVFSKGMDKVRDAVDKAQNYAERAAE